MSKHPSSYTLPSISGTSKIIDNIDNKPHEPLVYHYNQGLVSPRKIKINNMTTTIGTDHKLNSPIIHSDISLKPEHLSTLTSPKISVPIIKSARKVVENHKHNSIPIVKPIDPDLLIDISSIPRNKRTISQKVRFDTIRFMNLLGVEVPLWYNFEEEKYDDFENIDTIMDSPRKEINDASKDLVNDLSELFIQFYDNRVEIDSLKQQRDDWKNKFNILSNQTDSLNFKDWNDIKSLESSIIKTETAIREIDSSFHMSDIKSENDTRYLQLVGKYFCRLEELVFVLKKRLMQSESKFGTNVNVDEYASFDALKRDYANMKEDLEILKQREIHFSQNSLLKRYNITEIPIDSIVIFVSALQNELCALREIVHHVMYNSFHPFQNELVKAINASFLDENQEEQPADISKLLSPLGDFSGSSRTASIRFSINHKSPLQIASVANLMTPSSNHSRTGSRTGSFAVQEQISPNLLQSPTITLTSPIASARRMSILDVVMESKKSTLPKGQLNNGGLSARMSVGKFESPLLTSRNSAQIPIPYLDTGVKFDQVYDKLFQGQWPLVAIDSLDDRTVNEMRIKLLTEELDRVKQLNEILINEKKDDDMIEQQKLAATQLLTASQTSDLESLAQVCALPDEEISHRSRNRYLIKALEASRKLLETKSKDVVFNSKIVLEKDNLLKKEKEDNLKLLSLLKALLKHNPTMLDTLTSAQSDKSELLNIIPPSSVSKIDLSNVREFASTWITKAKNPKPTA